MWHIWVYPHICTLVISRTLQRDPALEPSARRIDTRSPRGRRILAALEEQRRAQGKEQER